MHSVKAFSAVYEGAPSQHTGRHSRFGAHSNSLDATDHTPTQAAFRRFWSIIRSANKRVSADRRARARARTLNSHPTCNNSFVVTVMKPPPYVVYVRRGAYQLSRPAHSPLKSNATCVVTLPENPDRGMISCIEIYFPFLHSVTFLKIVPQYPWSRDTRVYNT